MNAPANITPTRITAMSGSLLLARLDMSDAENVKDAQRELRRAGNDPAALAIWAGKWGEALVARSFVTEGGDYDPQEAADLAGELDDAERKIARLQGAVTDAISDVENAIEAKTSQAITEDAILKALNKLEEAAF